MTPCVDGGLSLDTSETAPSTRSTASFRVCPVLDLLAERSNLFTSSKRGRNYSPMGVLDDLWGFEFEDLPEDVCRTLGPESV